MFNLGTKQIVAIAAALPVFLLLVLLSDATTSDARRMLDDLAVPLNPTASIGHIYSVGPNGHIKVEPPTCRTDQAIIDGFFGEEQSDYILRNRLGYALPTAVDWLREVILIDLLSQSNDTIDRSWDDATKYMLEFRPLVIQQLKEVSLRNSLVAALAEDKDCSDWIASQWANGYCAVMLRRVVRSNGRLVGYEHDDQCIVPKLPDEAYTKRSYNVPQRARSFLERLTVLKTNLGLLDLEVNGSMTETVASN